MKKIFTFLLLVACFAMPRSASAIYWHTATGNEWRINPKNPANPNDSVKIPAGTKFFYIMGGAPFNGKFSITMTIGDILPHIYESSAPYAEKDFDGTYLARFYLDNTFLCVDGYDTRNLTSSNPNSYTTYRFPDDNFKDQYLRSKVMRNFGYTYALDAALDSSKHVFTSGTYNGYKYVHAYWTLNKALYRKCFDYTRKCVITEKEALELKKFNTDIYIGYDACSNLDGLEVFQNLEELQITSDFGSYDQWQHTTYTAIGGQFTQKFINWLDSLKVLHESDPTVFVPNIPQDSMCTVPPSQAGVERYYYLTMYLRCFPRLKKLKLRFRHNIGEQELLLSDHKTLEHLDIAGCNLRKVHINRTKLQYLNVENLRVLEFECDDANLNNLYFGTSPVMLLKCRRNNLTSLDLSGCRNIRQLYCNDNMLTSLTFPSDAQMFLNRVECQRNNLTSLTIPGTFVTDTILFCGASPFEPYGKYGTPIIPNGNSDSGYLLYRWPDTNIYGEKNSYPYDCHIWDYTSWEDFWNAARNGKLNIYYDYPLFQASYGPSYLDCSENSGLTALSIPEASHLKTLSCWNCSLTNLDLSACDSLRVLRMSNNRINEIDLSHCTQLEELYANNWVGVKGRANWNYGFTSLDLSGLSKLRLAQLSRNKMRDLNLSGCTTLQTLTCDNQGGDERLLRTLNLTGCNNLTNLECQNNGLTSLKMDDCTSLSSSTLKAYTQRAVEDVVVLDRNKVCIDLVNGITTDFTMDDLFDTWDKSNFTKEKTRIIKRDGKTYLVLYDISNDAPGGAQAKADVDFYEKKILYKYALWPSDWSENLGGSVANNKAKDNVTVTTYPYVMYINPATLDKYTDPQNTFYSGTIYLGYDAVVPEGTEVYIAQGLQLDREGMITGGENTTSGQLNLVKIEKAAGATNVVIPAYTPVYVKSPSETGLFDFARNLNNEPLATIPSGNIFKGTLRDTTVTPYDILTLSRGYKTGGTGPDAQSRVGFWRFNNTLLPAHRVYIEATEMDKVNASGVRGLTFAFFDSEADLPTSIDRMERVTGTIEQQQRGWYTVSGIRLKDKPTAKGVYIHNGKKVFVE